MNFGDNSLQESETAHEVLLKISCVKILREWEATNSTYEGAHF